MTIRHSPLATRYLRTNDANGNTLTGGGRTNTWDGQNRLVTCAYGGNTSSHVYGSDGLRRQSTVNSTVTDFILDGQSVVRSQVQGEGGIQKTWLHGARGPEYERLSSGDPVWYICDGLGSVTGTVDLNGNLVSTRKYDVYGAVRGSTGPSGPKHKYVGSLGHASEDETGLIYMQARYMDPITGRFVTEDPRILPAMVRTGTRMSKTTQQGAWIGLARRSRNGPRMQRNWLNVWRMSCPITTASHSRTLSFSLVC